MAAAINSSAQKKVACWTKELPNGNAYKFSGEDVTVDELRGFIKTGRQCCEFFTFNLSVKGDKAKRGCR
jgi:hypothetical protein